jgi:hypothetical protein
MTVDGAIEEAPMLPLIILLFPRCGAFHLRIGLYQLVLFLRIGHYYKRHESF